MGLSITGYSHLTYVGHCPDRDEDAHGYNPDTYDRIHVEAYAYTEFPHALLGVPNQLIISGYSGSKFLSGGCFAVTAKTETHRAGRSYGGYNQWRQDLADRFNPYRENGEPSPEGPFYELIWFADNEGTICQLAATTLLANFRQFEVEYAATHDEWDVQYYRDFLRACELAADGGLIDFH
jgi:hypothetical protein